MNIANDFVICRCEEVTYKELLHTANTYNCSTRELKLRTRAGMGFCGGRTCRCALESFISSQEQNRQPLKHQPPVRPVTFDLLGDRS
ncbi:pyridine nucleotide-disulfide oxidoreductase [Bacillus cereus]|uniref:(2Fe-2S)-binding protein n=1 Tax=Bacillus arachidis TaxID=2819290 RepID=A0ABS3P0H6_9BACI|nr:MULTISPECIES: (2Fe-2S)-binding protein [Bacillus]PGY03236.1 pyridine nucleotide-disulfide oxidoreductase [Bacillus cereus]MBO1626296.1 (2Fe-2S)-binding protein [Bacillus arachidis]PFE06467.1 pyridine nucleotide-disulfide oxidoreductase [Bacillus sp. AFS023182]WIY62012.1 (2Fe-2S)-binding protein [Bacillus arachidis]SDZ36432.1 BFD-like [2Fe-2S] binding domain-containing protein [Bacillus sp. 166amftsu]